MFHMKSDPRYKHTDYLEYLIRVDRLRKSVANVVRALERHVFDSIAFRGMSGALIAPSVALAMNKEIIMVRKPYVSGDKDRTHSCLLVEGFKASKRYVIIDDFICTGKTCNAIVEAIQEFAPDAIAVGAMTVSSCQEEETFEQYRGQAFPLYIQEIGKWGKHWTKREFTGHKIPRLKKEK